MKLRQVGNIAASSLSLPPDLLNVTWINQRIEEWASTGYLKPFRRLFQLVQPARLSAGNVAVTQNSKIVTPDSTALAAWSNDIVGRFLRAETNWYEIVGYDGAVATLNTVYVEDTSTETGYSIVPRRISLSPGIVKLGTFVNMRTGLPLMNRNPDVLDRLATNRADVASGPSMWTELNVDDSGNRVVELYPYSDSLTLISYTGYIKPKEYATDDELPSYIDASAIIEGVKLNLMERQMSFSLQGGNATVGEVWGNMAARQRTVWNKIKKDLANKSQAVDDATFILEADSNSVFQDVTNARDYVNSGWSSLT